MFCNQCATPIPHDGVFCPQCGARAISPVPPPPPSPPMPPPQPMSPQPAVPQGQPGQQAQLPGEPVQALPGSSPRASVRRRERRRERRRRARGFWYLPPINLMIVGLAAAAWYFIPTTIATYITEVDFSQLMAQAAQDFQYNSPRDLWDTYLSAILALVLAAALLIVSIMALFAVYRLIKRGVVASRRKKEWKKAKDELLRKELSIQDQNGAQSSGL